MPTRSVSPEVIECPLCCGAGELTRAEILDRLGVKDFARVAQLIRRGSIPPAPAASTTVSTRTRGRASKRNWRSGLPRSGSSTRTNCASRCPKRKTSPAGSRTRLREVAQLREQNQQLEGEMAKVARVGKREEMDFAEEARTLGWGLDQRQAAAQRRLHPLLPRSERRAC